MSQETHEPTEPVLFIDSILYAIITNAVYLILRCVDGSMSLIGLEITAALITTFISAIILFTAAHYKREKYKPRLIVYSFILLTILYLFMPTIARI